MLNEARISPASHRETASAVALTHAAPHR